MTEEWPNDLLLIVCTRTQVGILLHQMCDVEHALMTQSDPTHLLDDHLWHIKVSNHFRVARL